MNSARSSQTTPWWVYALVIPLIVVALPFAVIVGAAYALGSAAIYVLVWLVWNTRGKDILFVYSDSPIWKDYLETHIIPLISNRAIILNWSERNRWKLSLANFAFHHFGGHRAFNPLGVVFKPWRRAQVFRFWQPFRDFKHGKPAALDEVIHQFLTALPPRS